jgi:ABC-2 type transport system ATP-binding protein
VRLLRDSGVTIILTTHYIEEAEEMADRIGVIRKGELILVEDKTTLMQQLGKKQLIVQLRAVLDALPSGLEGSKLELSKDGLSLTYTYDARGGETGIAEVLHKLADLGLDFTDLRTKESSLEEIFVDLVGGVR